MGLEIISRVRASSLGHILGLSAKGGDPDRSRAAFKNTELLPSAPVRVGRGHFKSSQANLTNTGIKNRDRRARKPLKVTWSVPCLSKSQVERGGWRVEGGGRGKTGRPVRNASSGRSW